MAGIKKRHLCSRHLMDYLIRKTNFLVLLLFPFSIYLLQPQQRLVVSVRPGGQSVGDIRGQHRDDRGPQDAAGIVLHVRRVLGRGPRVPRLQRVRRLQHGTTLSAVRGLVWGDMEAGLCHGN